MSRFDQDREELIRLIVSICDYARLGYKISTYNSCNNCKAEDCEYKPQYGEAVRWNCPLWKGADDKDEPQKWTKENCKGCKYNEYPYDGGTCFVRVCINGNKYQPQTERRE